MTSSSSPINRLVSRSGVSVILTSILALPLTDCVVGPSEERVGCLQSCARGKDSCMLGATTAAGVQDCDARGSSCSKGCPP
jgi:hypothetical protein